MTQQPFQQQPPNQPPPPPPAANAYQQPPGLSASSQLQPGQGLLRVNIQGSVMTGNPITPTLMVDGYTMNSIYGANTFAVPAGSHQVELYAQWMRRYGQASMAVDVPAGAIVDVFYAAPLNQFTTGSIGLTKQRRRGLPMVGIMLAILLLLAAGIILVGALN